MKRLLIIPMIMLVGCASTLRGLDEQYFWKVAQSYVEEGWYAHPLIQRECAINYEKPAVFAAEQKDIPNKFDFPVLGVYSPNSNVIWYSKNDVTVLVHEYMHALTRSWSAACLQELNAYTSERLYHALDRNEYLQRKNEDYNRRLGHK